MASGILGGGGLTSYVQAHGYTSPSGKTTTTSLLLQGGPAAGNVSLSLGPATLLIAVPANGIVNLTGLILAAGQGVYLTAYSPDIKYLLTGWESTT